MVRMFKFLIAFLTGFFVPLLATEALLAAQGDTELVSMAITVGPEHVTGNGASWAPSISSDGRYIAFVSEAKDLVPDDTGIWPEVFIHDRQTGLTTNVSLGWTGEQGNNYSSVPVISADGRYVAFESYASNIVPGDTNVARDIFVHDRDTGQTTRVSVNSAGEEGNGDYGDSMSPSISADGRYVAFWSLASNLVSDDTNEEDVFVHDRQTGLTTMVSVNSAGQQGNGPSSYPSISADGRYVAFYSYASNLVPHDTNSAWDVFVHDRDTGQTTRVSVNSAGEEGNEASGLSSPSPCISADGRYVTFQSIANNLVPNDTNGLADIFVHDRDTGQTTRVSVNSAGEEGNGDYGDSMSPTISADGRYVAFWSLATNLVPDDTNYRSDVFVHDRQTGLTKRVSVSSAGIQGNSGSKSPAISSDGRYVVFESAASNFCPNDANGTWDVFVHDYLGNSSLADFNADGDVDGADLADLILGHAAIDLAAFARDFGRGN